MNRSYKGKIDSTILIAIGDLIAENFVNYGNLICYEAWTF